MRIISAGDATQLVFMVRKINRGVDPRQALREVVLSDGFPREVGKALAGYAAGRDARVAAVEISELVTNTR